MIYLQFYVLVYVILQLALAMLEFKYSNETISLVVYMHYAYKIALYLQF